MTERRSIITEALRAHWIEPFAETNALICHCGGWQWDGFDDPPAILLTDPLAQQSWWYHTLEAILTTEFEHD